MDIQERGRASLYVKDHVTAGRVARLALTLGTTQTETLRRALDALEGQLSPDERSRLFREKLAEWHRQHPLGEPTGLEADKAFYDSLNDEDED